MPNLDLAFGVLGTELWSPAGVALALKAYRRLGKRGLTEFAGRVVQTSRDRLTETFDSPRAHGLLAVQRGHDVPVRLRGSAPEPGAAACG